MKDCCDPSLAQNVDKNDSKTITLKIPKISKSASLIVLLLLAGLSVIQAVQVSNLRAQYSSGTVPAAKASAAQPASAPASSLDSLPSMVGGC